MREWCDRERVAVWAYCLMSNHVHLIAVPETESGLARAIGEAHRRYTRAINFREGWRGYLFQGRFASCPVDERSLMAAVRYVELNPVRAEMVEHAWDYRWSSAAAHVAGEDDRLVTVRPMLERVADWREYLGQELSAAELRALRRHNRTGRHWETTDSLPGWSRQPAADSGPRSPDREVRGNTSKSAGWEIFYCVPGNPRVPGNPPEIPMRGCLPDVRRTAGSGEKWGHDKPCGADARSSPLRPL
jgi:putative transposase